MSLDLKKRIDALERELSKLRGQSANVPLRPGTTGGVGFKIPTFTTFPPIPAGPRLISCKGQLWYAESTFTAWMPCVAFTTSTGAPGS